MAVKLRVPCDLAKMAIQEEIADLRKQNVLVFSGKTEKTITCSLFKFKDMSTIGIQLKQNTLPLNEFFDFTGWAKLIYETTDTKEDMPESYSDGRDYIVRGKTILTDKDGYIGVSIKNNTIEITDQNC